MINEKNSLFEFIKIIKILSQLNEWEINNFPLTNSKTGRFLYFRLAEYSLQKERNSSIFMKEFINHNILSEKSLRNRLVAMKDEGFITNIQNDKDGRSKFPEPSDKFNAAMYLHASQARRLIEKDFLLIDKSSNRYITGFDIHGH
jgi:hypothetical protein